MVDPDVSLGTDYSVSRYNDEFAKKVKARREKNQANINLSKFNLATENSGSTTNI